MADGELTLNLAASLVETLERKAAEVGSTAEALATALLEQHLFDYDDYEWDEDPRTVSPDLEDEAGPTFPAEEVMAEFRELMAARLANR